MLFLSKDDYYEVYLKSIISDFDRDTLSMLYQPIIGGAAVSLYLTLQQDHKKIDKQFTHEELVNSMGFSIDIIQSAREKLEAIGLLSSYYKRQGHSACLYQKRKLKNLILLKLVNFIFKQS